VEGQNKLNQMEDNYKTRNDDAVGKAAQVGCFDLINQI